MSVSIAIKYPGGVAGQVCSEPKYAWEQIADVNLWILSSLFDSLPSSEKPPFTVSWNDQRPSNDGSIRSDPRVGHTKGILVVTETETRLLVHSVPVFPHVKPGVGQREKYTIPSTAHKYGQSFLCLRLNCGWQKHQATYIELCNQLRVMGPGFSGHAPFLNMTPRSFQAKYTTFQLDLTPEKGWFGGMIRSFCRSFCRSLCCVLSFGTAVSVNTSTNASAASVCVFHVAKPPNHHDCIYEHLAEQFGGSCRAATWVKHPRMVPSPAVAHVVDIRACAPIYSEVPPNARLHAVYQSSNDHSKWAVSTHTPCKKHPCWVWVGDLNRMESQKTRGGGGVILIGNTALWTAMHSLCMTVSECT